MIQPDYRLTCHQLYLGRKQPTIASADSGTEHISNMAAALSTALALESSRHGFWCRSVMKVNANPVSSLGVRCAVIRKKADNFSIHIEQARETFYFDKKFRTPAFPSTVDVGVVGRVGALPELMIV
ncbi:hypothetical protein J6590_041929 [Homalodisca vitripennis]|nr:hypothetical protein J6590_041929 [Homalodisca vitripennis]